MMPKSLVDVYEHCGSARPSGAQKQFVPVSQSTTRPFGVQSQQLLTESEIFKDEVLAGTESTAHPSEEMSERPHYGQNHSQNLIETRRLRLVSK